MPTVKVVVYGEDPDPPRLGPWELMLGLVRYRYGQAATRPTDVRAALEILGPCYW